MLTIIAFGYSRVDSMLRSILSTKSAKNEKRARRRLFFCDSFFGSITIPQIILLSKFSHSSHICQMLEKAHLYDNNIAVLLKKKNCLTKTQIQHFRPTPQQLTSPRNDQLLRNKYNLAQKYMVHRLPTNYNGVMAVVIFQSSHFFSHSPQYLPPTTTSRRHNLCTNTYHDYYPHQTLPWLAARPPPALVLLKYRQHFTTLTELRLPPISES